MTIICVKNGVMAADSYVFCGGIKWQAPVTKIFRHPQGLIGLSGEASDCYFVGRWWVSGGQSYPPKLQDGERSVGGLILDYEGVWLIDHRLEKWPTIDSSSVGNGDATSFCEGAMHAGASAEEAVRLAIKHCVYVGGDVQVERLTLPE